MNIEDTLFCRSLPVNTLAMINRLQEILKEEGTNSILTFIENPEKFEKQIFKTRQILWLLVSQLHQHTEFDLYKEYKKLLEMKQNFEEVQKATEDKCYLCDGCNNSNELGCEDDDQ